MSTIWLFDASQIKKKFSKASHLGNHWDVNVKKAASCESGLVIRGEFNVEKVQGHLNDNFDVSLSSYTLKYKMDIYGW